MDKKEKEKKEELCTATDILFDPEDVFTEMEQMNPEEKKEYLDFLWRQRLFSC